ALVSWQTLSAGERLTYVDLVRRLTDLEALSVLPPPGEKCQQWSSYDRASKYDAATGKYVRWDANGDGGGIIRKEGELSVFAEMEGPGVIWRTWSATAGQGHVKIYLDGAPEPAVDQSFSKYFDGTEPPFLGKALCHTVANGKNCYVPIPFQKSCKIVAEKGWGNYYHFTYTTFPKDTVVPTFNRNLSAEEVAALAKADEFLAKRCGDDPAGARVGESTEDKTVMVAAGGTAVIAELAGPRAITTLRAKLDLPAKPADRDLLRELCLRITWDDEAQPAVWTPLGDFFGAAPGFNKYRSLPLGMTEDGFYSFWYMPFAKKARLELINDGSEARTVAFHLTHAPLARPVDKLARFHAKWHRDTFPPEEAERRAIDWTMLKTQGGGRFVGVMLHIWNPRGGWWGEGDEKFFVDGEKFPSTIGTGSEDYFGYAWSSAQLFTHAFHNQPHNDGGSRGHVSVNRWHISDNVPFQQSFEAAIEKYFKNEKPTLYAAMVFWYQAAGQADGYAAVPLAERTGWYVQPPNTRVAGALEGEALKIIECSGGGAAPQEMSGRPGTWSDQSHLWWTKGKPGDRLALAVPVKEDGRYKLTLQLTKAVDYGIVQLSLDGQKLGAPIDLYNPSVIPSGPLEFGLHELKKGEHRLTVEMVGANEKARKAYMAGLDYLKLERVP
ncbi:MAG: DUF2961 domain-containing protein, partial [Verrucomicrobia bacterium]|nr:DUF2961 domain-containing protein [Verrucomicrobiota bacterium]